MSDAETRRLRELERENETLKAQVGDTVKLRAALVDAIIPYEALLMDAPSRKWIAPSIWEHMERACRKARAITGCGE